MAVPLPEARPRACHRLWRVADEIRPSSRAASTAALRSITPSLRYRAFLPETVSRFLAFYAGGGLLGVEVDTTTPETLAVALSPSQDALVFGGYAGLVLVAGTVLLWRTDIPQGVRPARDSPRATRGRATLRHERAPAPLPWWS